jgi:hypothetical protein
MLKSLRIKNFKAWKDTGEIRLAPITVFFGGNSAGKTSLLQFLLMLKQTAESSDRRRVLNPGDSYAQLFEEEYNARLNEILTLEDTKYNQYLRGIATARTHEGYFSIDKKSKRLVNPETGARSTESDDVDAYDLILKNKKRLLQFDEPVRFLFSHSALREGWDNPNVFVIGMLKHSDNTVSRRQEVGRGLRLSVNQNGDRMDDPATVMDFVPGKLPPALGTRIAVRNLPVCCQTWLQDRYPRPQREAQSDLQAVSSAP